MTNNPDQDVVYTQAPTAVVAERRRRGPGFIAGVIAAIVIAVAAVAIYLAVSDSDDDGNIDVDVPAVDVQVDEGG